MESVSAIAVQPSIAKGDCNISLGLDSQQLASSSYCLHHSRQSILDPDLNMLV